jgi:outer membrane protein assembly factor BamD
MRHAINGFKSSSAILIGICLLATASCGGGKQQVSDSQLGGRAADTILMELGQKELEDHDWTDARNYCQQLLDTYPRSQLAGDARICIADSYFHQKGAGNIVLAIAEYRDFLTFFPNHPRADYAQYQIALGYFKQIKGAERDQEPTRTAVEELNTLIDLYRNSLYAEEGRELLAECYERLAEHEYSVGRFYLKSRKWCRGAIPRLKGVLESYPTYTKSDEVYYYLGEAFMLCRSPSEAMSYYQQLVDDYPDSKYKSDAEKKLNELKSKAPDPQKGQPQEKPSLK